MVSRQPLVGISTSEVRSPGDRELVSQGEPARTELALGERYLDAVRAAGGMPVILAPVGADDIPSLVERLDAIVLSGGPDLDPSAYGARAHPQLGPTEPELDRFELELARVAVTRALPVLGICRGMQVLNVALGGSLHQHLPDLSETVEHRQGRPAGEPTHRVTLGRDSRLTKVIGRRYVEVNSFHHQGLHSLGKGLTIAGHAPDGQIEAIEVPGRRFHLRRPVARGVPGRPARAARAVPRAGAGRARPRGRAADGRLNGLR
jgi:putative glutamine amidotransferase